MDHTKRILIAVNVPAAMAEETAVNIVRDRFGEPSNPKAIPLPGTANA